jgi:hypothetical protein
MAKRSDLKSEQVIRVTVGVRQYQCVPLLSRNTDGTDAAGGAGSAHGHDSPHGARPNEAGRFGAPPATLR